MTRWSWASMRRRLRTAAIAADGRLSDRLPGPVLRRLRDRANAAQPLLQNSSCPQVLVC